MKCPKCGFGMVRSIRVWNSRTLQVLVKWSCGHSCGWVAYEPAIHFDENDCEHPVYMTRKQWFESNRELDPQYLALAVR